MSHLVRSLPNHADETVTVTGWIAAVRVHARVAFLMLRDGTGTVQGVLVKSRLPADIWDLATSLAQESVRSAHRGRPPRPPRPRRTRADRVRKSSSIGASDEYPDPAQGTRRRVPSGPPPPVAAVEACSARGCRVRAEVEQGDPRLLLRARFRAHRHAHPDRRDRRVGGDALRDRLLRRAGVSGANGAALRRVRVSGLPQGLLLRADLPGREVEDAPPPDRILDDRARDGLRGFERQHGPAGGVRLLHRGAGARALPARAGGAGTRPGTGSKR